MTSDTISSRVHVVVDSPVGPLTLVAQRDKLTGLYMDAQRHSPDPALLGTPGDPADEPFASAAKQLAAYFSGELTTFDLPLAPTGTEFQLRVWEALRTIPYGQTLSYGELARQIGSPAASRAVGLANGRNPIALVVPCHRVIGADGSLTGYGGGIDRKRFLLDLERTVAGVPGVAPREDTVAGVPGVAPREDTVAGVPGVARGEDTAAIAQAG